MTTKETKNLWLVELCGDNRQVWGPYSRQHAEAEKGARHFIAMGDFTNGQTLTRGTLQAALQSGSVIAVEDGIDISSIA